MAALAGDLSRKILGHSDAAKAFRPWWDTLEDNLLYAFVVMGKTKILIILGSFLTIEYFCLITEINTAPAGSSFQGHYEKGL